MRLSSLINKGLLLAFSSMVFSPAILAQDVTFHKDIEPILQRACQNCHRPGGVAPMPLVNYDEVAPFAGLIEYKTGLRDRAGAMPPWYAEKNIGIKQLKNDPSLSEAEIAAISTWARTGASKGNEADAPAPLVFDDSIKWSLGVPDLIVNTEDFFMAKGRPDWWGEIPSVPTGLTEDRYVKSIEVVEVNDVGVGDDASDTVGGLFIFHHMIWRTEVEDENGKVIPGQSTNWPVHEVGRNGDVFDPDAGPLLKANSAFYTDSVHMHSNGRDTVGHLQLGFTFHPIGYKPKFKSSISLLGNGVDISVEGDAKDQEMHAYLVLTEHTKVITFEPHLHAPGARMCLEAIWGYSVETLSCVGYDHNWVRGYAFEDDYTPLLPKGTVLHITGYFDNTTANYNVPDARNWQGAGNRSVTNMFIDLGIRVTMTDEQFEEEMEKRRTNLALGPNDHVIGCPLCLTPFSWPVVESAESGE
ncbi:MAG: cytochrome c [Gammaproteobacteria bacterium]|nr:cytochrome c [Gammaproteobacteria bacterium]